MLKHTYTQIALSQCTVGCSHGKIQDQSQKAALFGSRGQTSQLGSGKLIQTVVSQVRGSVGTGERSERGTGTAPRRPVKILSSALMQISGLGKG